jgi:hypothetical protein
MLAAMRATGRAPLGDAFDRFGGDAGDALAREPAASIAA